MVFLLAMDLQQYVGKFHPWWIDLRHEAGRLQRAWRIPQRQRGYVNALTEGDILPNGRIKLLQRMAFRAFRLERVIRAAGLMAVHISRNAECAAWCKHFVDEWARYRQTSERASDEFFRETKAGFYDPIYSLFHAVRQPWPFWFTRIFYSIFHYALPGHARKTSKEQNVRHLAVHHISLGKQLTIPKLPIDGVFNYYFS